MKKITFVFILFFSLFVVWTSSFAGTVWLDEVILFDRPEGSSDDGGPPESALGPPVSGVFVSIDIPETLILAFTDNSALDGGGNDIHVYQHVYGDSWVNIYGSKNNADYVFLGTTKGDVEYNLSDYNLDFVNYLKFVGLDDGGGKDGYDLKAVEALNSGAHVPIPGAVWLLGSGLISMVGIGRKFKK